MLTCYLVPLIFTAFLDVEAVLMAGKDRNCGRQFGGNKFIKPLVLSGTQTSHEQFPWHATLFHEEYGPFCGGVLISHTTVLTAAHCLLTPDNIPLNASDIKVKIGLSDDDHRGENFVVSHYITHELYRGEEGSYANDVALVVILWTQWAQLRQHEPICIPVDKPDLSIFYNNDVFITGTGSTTNLDNLQETNLKFGKLTVSTPQCWEDPIVQQLTRDRIPKVLCTKGSLTSDTCSGDSGGPLISNQRYPHQFELIGVVSFSARIKSNGTRCGHGIPSFHSDVIQHIDWIVHNEERQGLCSVYNKHCKACKTKSDCSALGYSYCWMGQCVDCILDYDCKATHYCYNGLCRGRTNGIVDCNCQNSRADELMPRVRVLLGKLGELAGYGSLDDMCTADTHFCYECTPDVLCTDYGFSTCVNGVCTDCVNNEDCGYGRLCLSGICTECAEDSHCDGGVCMSGKCQECARDTDCDSGLTCLNTQCQVAGAVLLGGSGNSEKQVETIYCNSSQSFPDIPTPRTNRPNAAFIEGNLLLCGGYSDRYERDCLQLGEHGDWRQGPRMNEGRTLFTMSKIGNRLVAIGGRSAYDVLDTTEIYERGYWKRGPDIYPARESHCSVPISEDGVVILGGRDSDENMLDLVQIMNVDTGEFTELTKLSEGRAHFSCLFDGDLIVVAGGLTSRDGSVEFVDTVEKLNFRSRNSKWRSVPALPLKTFDGTLTVLGGQAHLFNTMVQPDKYYIFKHDGSAKNGLWEVERQTPRNRGAMANVPCSFRSRATK